MQPSSLPPLHPELQMLLMSGRRGSLLFASTTVRRHIAHFYLAVTQPWGYRHDATQGVPANAFLPGAFTWDETNGGVAKGPKHADVQIVRVTFVWIESVSFGATTPPRDIV